MDDSAITCDEIIDADAEAKSNNEETKTCQNLMKKIQLMKDKFSLFY